MTLQERAERTRNVILDAAAAVFEEHGVNGAGVAEILSRAGVTKGALYFHFSSKEELAKAIIEEQLTLELPPLTDPATAMQGLIDALHTFGEHLRDNVRVRASNRLVLESDPVQMVEVYQHWLKILTERLVAAQAAGDLRDEWTPEDAATFVGGSYLGMQILSGALTDHADIRDRITHLWQHGLIPGLVPPKRQARLVPSGTI